MNNVSVLFNDLLALSFSLFYIVGLTGYIKNINKRKSYEQRA